MQLELIRHLMQDHQMSNDCRLYGLTRHEDYFYGLHDAMHVSFGSTEQLFTIGIIPVLNNTTPTPAVLSESPNGRQSDHR